MKTEPHSMDKPRPGTLLLLPAALLSFTVAAGLLLSQADKAGWIPAVLLLLGLLALLPVIWWAYRNPTRAPCKEGSEGIREQTRHGDGEPDPARLAAENRRLRQVMEAAQLSAERAERDAREALLLNRKLLKLLNRDIRTPLGSLLGIVELLRDSNLDAHARRLTESLHQSVESLLEVIQSLPSPTNPDGAGDENSNVDLQALLEDATRPFRNLAPHKGIGFSCDIPSNLPQTVKTDPRQLTRMLEGLLKWSFNHSGKDGRVRFRTVLHPPSDGDSVWQADFQICLDQPASALQVKQALHPLSTGGDIRETPDELASIRQQAREAGGTLKLTDTASDNPCLALQLPLEVADTGDSPGDTTPHRRKVHRILLVEDNAVNQMITRSMLEALGCQVELAEGGEAAVAKASQERFDLIFMDCHMPGMDGFETCHRIREAEMAAGQQPVPIVALTADINEGTEARCRQAGMNDYVTKPYTREDLADVLTRWSLAADGTTTSSPTPIDGNEEKILDQARLDALRAIGRERGSSLLEKAVRHFIDHAPEELGRLRKAASDGMAEQVRLIAHNLKSSSDMLGARKLARRFADLERLAREGEMGRLTALLEEVEEMMPEVLEALEQALRAPVAKQSLPAEAVQGSGRILVVDDDPAFRLVTVTSLREAGFEVFEATNGVGALASIDEHPPDLILLDALMEDIDGFEICRRLQQNPVTRRIPVLMVTGLEDTESVHRAFQAGAAGFITKPVNYPVLIHRVRFQLRVAREAEELRESREQLAMAQQLARLGHWRWEPAQDRFEISEQLARICELETGDQEISLEAYLQLLEPEDREQLRFNIRNALEKGVTKPLDYRITTASGKTLFMHQELTLPKPGILLATVQDVTRQYESEQKIRKLAYSDELTGLASRSYFLRHLEDTIAIAGRHQEKFSLLYLDLDSFKDINDTLGHDVGDELLKVVAQRLSKVLRKTDFAARLGGDEFCILVDNVSIGYAAEIASRCLEEVNKPIQLGPQTFNPRISIGIANFPGDGRDAHTLLKAADSAMYAAKQEGKHRYAFYQPELTIRAKKRLDMEHELRRALDKEQLELHYQPQISLLTGRICGVEALVRWRHPERGLVPPDEFIHVAERIGLIKQLGNWVLETACHQGQQWMKAGHEGLQIAVNISPLHFKDPEIVQQVDRILTRSGCPAGNLELEVTENVVQTEPENMESFKRLKELGVRIAIDDFGTGYSSLSSLKKLPIDCLKVDQLFIRDMMEDPQSATLVGTIIGLAKALGLQVVAEGVENDQEIQILTGLGCDIVQGFFFSRPVTPDRLEKLLAQDFSALVLPSGHPPPNMALGPGVNG